MTGKSIRATKLYIGKVNSILVAADMEPLAQLQALKALNELLIVFRVQSISLFVYEGCSFQFNVLESETPYRIRLLISSTGWRVSLTHSESFQFLNDEILRPYPVDLTSVKKLLTDRKRKYAITK